MLLIAQNLVPPAIGAIEIAQAQDTHNAQFVSSANIVEASSASDGPSAIFTANAGTVEAASPSDLLLSSRQVVFTDDFNRLTSASLVGNDWKIVGAPDIQTSANALTIQQVTNDGYSVSNTSEQNFVYRPVLFTGRFIAKFVGYFDNNGSIARTFLGFGLRETQQSNSRAIALLAMYDGPSRLLVRNTSGGAWSSTDLSPSISFFRYSNNVVEFLYDGAKIEVVVNGTACGSASISWLPSLAFVTQQSNEYFDIPITVLDQYQETVWAGNSTSASLTETGLADDASNASNTNNTVIEQASAVDQSSLTDYSAFGGISEQPFAVDAASVQRQTPRAISEVASAADASDGTYPFSRLLETWDSGVIGAAWVYGANYGGNVSVASGAARLDVSANASQGGGGDNPLTATSFLATSKPYSLLSSSLALQLKQFGTPTAALQLTSGAGGSGATVFVLSNTSAISGSSSFSGINLLAGWVRLRNPSASLISVDTAPLSANDPPSEGQWTTRGTVDAGGFNIGSLSLLLTATGPDGPALPSGSNALAVDAINTNTTTPVLLPPAIGPGSELFSPSLFAGPVSVDAPLIVSGGAVYAPVVASGVSTLLAPYIEPTARLFEPTASAAAVTVSPPRLTNTTVFFGPTLQANVTAALYGSTAALFPPAVAVGSVIVVPPFLAANNDLFESEIYGGSYLVRAPKISASEILFAPTAVRGQAPLVPAGTAKFVVTVPVAVTLAVAETGVTAVSVPALNCTVIVPAAALVAEAA